MLESLTGRQGSFQETKYLLVLPEDMPCNQIHLTRLKTNLKMYYVYFSCKFSSYFMEFWMVIWFHLRKYIDSLDFPVGQIWSEKRGVILLQDPDRNGTNDVICNKDLVLLVLNLASYSDLILAGPIKVGHNVLELYTTFW